MLPRKSMGEDGLFQSERAFTLLEIIIVIGIVAFVYAVALPNFGLQTGSDVANRLGRLSEDIRAAYDLTVLSGKPHRMVFQLATGKYWLEGTDSKLVVLGDRLRDRDLEPQQEEYRAAEFDEEFEKYVDLAGEAFKDPLTDDPIAQVTPVLKAKEALRGPKWFKMETLEWQARSIGPYLVVRDVQSEHHERPITLDDHGKDAVAMVYFLPSGYVEKTVMHIYYRKGDDEIDQDQAPYTLIINSYIGTADIRTGYEEINVHSDEDKT